MGPREHCSGLGSLGGKNGCSHLSSIDVRLHQSTHGCMCSIGEEVYKGGGRTIGWSGRLGAEAFFSLCTGGDATVTRGKARFVAAKRLGERVGWLVGWG